MPLGASRLAFLAKTSAAVAAGRTAKDVTSYGGAQIDTAQSKFGGASGLFDGVDDGLIVDDALTWSGGAWTIEGWFRFINTSTNEIITDFRLDGNITRFPGLRNGRFAYYAGGWQVGSVRSANTWYHVAWVYDGTNVKMYVDGTLDLTYSEGGTFGDSRVSIGARYDIGSGWFDGHIDEYRISDNARYTSNFTAPTEPFGNDENTQLLLHMNGTDGSTSFIDDNLSKAQGGDINLYNDGTNDYIVHTFTSSGTFTPSEALTIDALVVGGGGGGGASDGGFTCGGGGGGGQVNYQTSISASATGYTITVGSGGGSATNGSDSSAFSYTAEGGGYGGGGGGAAASRTNAAGGGGRGHWQGNSMSGGSGTYAGGNGATGPELGGGGGGNGGVGSNAGSGSGGNGGNGVASTDIFSSGTTYYAGGGGGSCLSSSFARGTGTHGGGNGGDGTTGSNGTANTGGGGGGSGGSNKAGGSGGSGIVKIRYQV